MTVKSKVTPIVRGNMVYVVMGYQNSNPIPVAVFSSEACAKEFVLDRARCYGIYHSEWIVEVDFYPEGNPEEIEVIPSVN